MPLFETVTRFKRRRGIRSIEVVACQRCFYRRSPCCRVQAEAMGAQPITVYLSLNFLAEQGLEVGSRLPLKLMPERMRFF